MSAYERQNSLEAIESRVGKYSQDNYHAKSMTVEGNDACDIPELNPQDEKATGRGAFEPVLNQETVTSAWISHVRCQPKEGRESLRS